MLLLIRRYGKTHTASSHHTQVVVPACVFVLEKYFWQKAPAMTNTIRVWRKFLRPHQPCRGWTNCVPPSGFLGYPCSCHVVPELIPHLTVKSGELGVSLAARQPLLVFWYSSGLPISFLCGGCCPPWTVTRCLLISFFFFKCSWATSSLFLVAC